MYDLSATMPERNFLYLIFLEFYQMPQKNVK